MARKDYTGCRFGKLTVIKEIEPYRAPSGKPTRRYLCQCDCGNTVAALTTELVSGHITSCGCSRIGSRLKYAPGQRFGRWTVIEQATLPNPTRSRKTGYLCRCDCGTEKVLTSKDLLSTQSCGCLLSETGYDKIVNQNVLGLDNGTMLCKIKLGMKPTAANTTGIRGVSYNGIHYRARIGYKGRSIELGRFKRLEDAVAARKKAEEQYYAPHFEQGEQTPDDINAHTTPDEI